MAAASTKVRVELVRVDGSPALYVGEPNAATLRLINQTGADITIAPGEPTPVPPPGGPLQIHLYLSGLFTDGDAGQVTVEAAGWTTQYFGKDERYPAWAMAGTEQTVWPRDGVLTFAVGNLCPDVPPGPHDVQVELYNLPSAYAVPSTLVVPVENRPSPNDLDLRTRVTMTLDRRTVTITKRADDPQYTELRLRLSNDDPSRDVVPPKVPWESVDPEFTVSFVLANDPPGYYALTTPDKAATFEVGVAHGDGWSAERDASGTKWRLRPKRYVNHAILGTGTSAFAEFSIREMETQFTPGPTLMYVQYTNVPGYNDGFFTAVIDKVYGELRILGFSASRQRFAATLEPGTAYLTWDVEHSSLVELSGHGPVPPKGRAFPVSVDRNERLVLTAYDSALCEIASESVAFEVDPPISMRWLPCGAIVLWRGSVTDIPHGFALCDGANGTPDLRDRFVEGAGPADPPGSSGDSRHAHALDGFRFTTRTSVDGSHSHYAPWSWYNRKFGNDWWAPNRTAIDTNGSFTSDHLQEAGAHDHAVSDDAGTVMTGEISGRVRPKWYAACWIMKLLTPARRI